ncbi:hypothetical protein C1O31_09805 [Staphylococcus schleiferi]|nr:hypothetical protein [Staphylococcus schleiferi]
MFHALTVVGEKMENYKTQEVRETPLSAQNANVFIKCVKEYDWLKDIIVNGYFQYRYVTEEIGYLNLKEYSVNDEGTFIQSITFPMLCFCDIPLNQLNDHNKWYGDYAICMKKSWGIEKKLQPLHYVINTSDYIKMYQNIFNNIISRQNIEDETFEFIFNSLFYLKHFKGQQYCEKTDKLEEKIFMDEQEWRSIKFFDQDIETFENFYINEDSGYKKVIYNDALTKLNDNRLEFKCEDIRYLIVKSEEDVIKLIKDINKSNYNEEEKSILISKISVLDYLREDFM